MLQVLGSVNWGFGFLVIFVIPILIFILADCELFSCDITESLIPDFTVWLFKQWLFWFMFWFSS